MLNNKIKAQFNKQQLFANKICKMLNAEGFNAYWVGGAVRDLLLKNKNFDIDIATNAKSADVKRVILKLGLPFFDVGEKFGTVGLNIGTTKIEITTFRKESSYTDSRHPSKVKFVDSVSEEAARRDFTINAIYFNPLNKELLDFSNGQKDLKAKILRFVGLADKRIKEDPLRMLRAVRFASALNFKIEQISLSAIKRNSKLISKVTSERIKQELDKILLDINYVEGLKLLDRVELLKVLLPEVDRLKKVKQSKNYHAEGDVFTHTLGVLKNSKSEDLIIRYTCLFHDLGKFGTAKKTIRDGRAHVSFLNHGSVGAKVFLEIAKRLRFSAKETSKISWLIEHHMDFRHTEKLSDKVLLRWSKNENIIDLINLRMSDDLGSIHTDKHGRVVKNDFSNLKSIAKKFQNWNINSQKNLVSGTDVMRILKLPQSKKIGYILEKIKAEQRLGRIKTRKQGITFIKSLDN